MNFPKYKQKRKIDWYLILGVIVGMAATGLTILYFINIY